MPRILNISKTYKESLVFLMTDYIHWSRKHGIRENVTLTLDGLIPGEVNNKDRGRQQDKVRVTEVVTSS